LTINLLTFVSCLWAIPTCIRDATIAYCASKCIFINK
jgi:hypothetical protein